MYERTGKVFYSSRSPTPPLFLLYILVIHSINVFLCVVLALYRIKHDGEAA